MRRPALLNRARWTIRLRLALLYGVLFLAAGAALLTVTYILVAHAFPFSTVPTPAKPATPVGPVDVLPSTAPGMPDLKDSVGRQRKQDLRQFLLASGLALGFMTVVSVGLGAMMAGRVLRPLRTITATAREISARNLHQRLDVRRPDDEIKDLADTFDGLLDRLETAFEAQRLFVANASHELRTPLTFERSLLEVALADPDASADRLRATCRRVLSSNQQQEHLIEALLTLARSQRGLDRRETLDLAEITRPLLDVPSDLDIRAKLTPAPTTGDPRLVERLIANLVENAVRHNTPAGQVTVWTGLDDGRATLHVTNTGPAIPPDKIEALFQPFRRLETTRTAQDGGLGLGLSIVAAIANAHDADLQADPRPGGGLDIRITFP